ncbi:MAG: hypothetical protein AAB776_03535 [Patescibacteria group bacterium]
MKRTCPVSEVQNALEVLRKAGYSYFRDPQSGEESFILRLTSEFYPRFHLYVENEHHEVTFDLHLDQKKPSYGDNTKHSGEYTGSTIEKEMQRIDSWIKAVNREKNQDSAEHDIDVRNKQQQKKLGQELKRWWYGLFR